MKPLALKAHAKELEIAYRVQLDVPDGLIGDHGRVRQVLVNLVGNAIKFTEKGEVVLNVTIADPAEVGDAPDPLGRDLMLHFQVKDSGIGIPADKLEAVFEAFTQADGSTTRKFGGTGLGLTICKKLVHMMGGRVWAESEFGKGTTFHFTARFGQSKSLPLSHPPIAYKELRGMPVLIVDDNATNRRILEEMLRGWQMRPVVVDSAHAALDAMKEAGVLGGTFPLVLTDGMMPDVSGLELSRLIKENPQYSGTSVILLSSACRIADSATCKEAGLAAYLIKPLRQSELLETIQRVMGDSPMDTRSSSQTSRQAQAGAEIGEDRSMCILLAEDNAVNQKLATRMLEKRGHTVLVANNGLEALEFLESSEFDVVLMDVHMPEMDGLTATAEIRRREAASGRHTPIIALTANAMKGDRERCIEAGCDDYVSKPIDSRKLFETIEKLRENNPRAATEAKQQTPELVVFDRAAALQCVEGDEELLREVLDMFLGDSPGLMEEIARAVESGDRPGLDHSAHTLKGMAANVGATGVRELAYRLECAGRSGNLGETARDLDLLRAELARFENLVAEPVA